MKNNNVVMVVDGTSMLVDAYQESCPDGLKNAKTLEEKESLYHLLEKASNGRYIGAVRGLFATILEAVDKINPTHIAVVWGTSRKSNCRKEIYSGYKADDSQMDEPLREQFRTAQAMLMPLIKQFTSNSFEAIDLAGTIANKLYDKAEIHILARNGNYLQLADISNVYLKTSRAQSMNTQFAIDDSAIPVGFFKYNKDMVKYVKELEPHQILGFNAIVGNPSSGIPGVKGVGATTAKPLISRFSTIDKIYEAIENIDSSELASIFKSIGIRNPVNKLIQGKEMAFISRDLYEINRDVFVDGNDLEDLNNILTVESVSRELNRVGLLTGYISNAYSLGSQFSYRALLEDLNIGTSESETPFISNSTSTVELGLRGEEEELEDSLDDNFMEYDGDGCYVIRRSDDSVGNYDECEEEYDYEDDNQDIDDGGDYYDFEVVTESQNNEINTLKEDTISLVDSFVVNKYRCNHCEADFVLLGSADVKFCPNCGIRQESRIEINIDNLEESGCDLNSIVRKCNVLGELKI